MTDKIPDHLQPYIARQDARLYTPIDHASWRFILRVSKAYFAQHAHKKYQDGLEETGISTERIPLVEEMDQKLRRFGWRAVPVSGFIPPAVFMEFQSLGILPIACEMRKLENLAYTPAPDIVHEAAGHAPIIADPEYSAYLRAYGEISRKAIFSDQDMALYQAIFELSETKEDPSSSPQAIEAAQQKFERTAAGITWASEASLMGRMNWWTVEYGLVGDMKAPKIYGAGLLSSVGESYHCLSDEVEKIPFSLKCIETTYDITRPQPQLFVAPDFAALTRVLEEFADTMAFRQGGMTAVAKGIQAKALVTAQLDTGIQMSGVLVDSIADKRGEPAFLKFNGPTQLAFGDQELPGHSTTYHKEGFSTPVGPIAQGTLESGRLLFASGIELQGRFKGSLQKDGKTVVASFEDCTIRLGDRVLFQPDWGTFDLALGEKVVSVFGGAADRVRYQASVGGEKQKPRPPKTNLTDENRELNQLYLSVREIRESGKARDKLTELTRIHDQLESRYKTDWLLRLELLELDRAYSLKAPWGRAIESRLKEISNTARDKAEMIERGLALL